MHASLNQWHFAIISQSYAFIIVIILEKAFIQPNMTQLFMCMYIHTM